MADYVKVNFSNEVPATTPVKYKISQTTDGDVATDATIELVTSVTPGTPLNAANLDHMETGIFNAQAAADDAQAAAAAAQADATQALADAAAAIPKSVVTTSGDLIVATGAGALTRLAKGAVNGGVLSMASGNLAWDKGIGATVNLSATVTSDYGGLTYATVGETDYSNVLTVNAGLNRIVIPAAMGSNLPYLISLRGQYDADTSGYGILWINVSNNAQSAHQISQFVSGGLYPTLRMTASGIFILSPGDYVMAGLIQHSSGSKSFTGKLSVFLLR